MIRHGEENLRKTINKEDSLALRIFPGTAASKDRLFNAARHPMDPGVAGQEFNSDVTGRRHG